jgi:protein-disulfide isomerase
MNRSDPRTAIVIGIIAIAVLMLIGIVCTVAFASRQTSADGGREDANVAFVDDGDPFWGPEDAKVVIRIFEDFECAACAVAKQGVDYVKRTYGDRVRIIWNDFPLDASHPRARIASNAARCAEEQGAFWEYHDLLFGKRDEWTAEESGSNVFIEYARQIGLNGSAFAACLDERRYNEKIQNDADEALANRVDVTPTFFVNKRRYTGVLSAEDWDRALQPLVGAMEEEEDVRAEPEFIQGAEPIDLNVAE